MNIGNWLSRIGLHAPQRPAILSGKDTLLTYGELHSRVAALSLALAQEFGVKKGDRVGLVANNHPHYFEVVFAAWYAGAVIVPVNAKLHASEAAWILKDSNCKLVFSDAAHSEALAAACGQAVINIASDQYDCLVATSATGLPADRAPDDTAWLFYTSGTTGKPKGVIITHRNLMAMTACFLADVSSIRDTDHWLYAAPASHGAGLYGLPYFLKGARHVFPVSGGFSPGEILDLSSSISDISFFAAPTMVRRLIQSARDTGHKGDGFSTIVYGGGPMYLSDITDAISQFGQKFVQIYGQGESPMSITVLTRQMHAAEEVSERTRLLSSVGISQSFVEVRIADENGMEVESGETGEILVRGDTVMSGYWQSPEATRQSIRDGWLWTGDMGAMDDDGLLFLKDRSKDLIISGGTNIYPREVEDALLTHPGVAETSVVGRPDEEWGEAVIAFIRLEEGADVSREDLDEHCMKQIARFKRPREYIFVSELPKNNYGKVLKTELRRLAAAPDG